MCFYLAHHADVLYEGLRCGTDDDDDASDDKFRSWMEWYQAFVPRALQMQLAADKSMRFEFAEVLLQISECFMILQMPNDGNVMLGPAFVQKGGTLKCVADMVFGVVKSKDELAGVHPSPLSRHTYQSSARNKPAACRNDHEFGLVSGLCGFTRIQAGEVQY